ncbi:MAG TPA: sensor histidine kinase [Roseomonas sp.]|jgi:two-component sensor histidine kinase
MSEADLRRALAEKDALLAQQDLLMREASHRVKNSLHLLSSALRMQAARAIPDRSENEDLVRASQRINSVALVHDRLHRSATGAHVEFGPYLRSLCADLQDSAVLAPGQRIDARIEEGSFPGDTAVRLGLIANELVTNALKHAYVGRPPGNVEVIFARHSEETWQLSVSDSGKGLPGFFNPAASSGLGMRLVHCLVRALNGQLQVEQTCPGTRFRILLPSI